MNRKIVLMVTLVVISATVFPVTGLLPTKAGIADQLNQMNHGVTASTAASDIWPMFRNDPGNTGCSLFYAPNTNHVKWKNQITSEIYGATPILYGDNVYVSTNWYYKGAPKTTNPFQMTPPLSPQEFIQNLLETQHDAGSGVYCLNAETGAEVWFRQMYSPNDPAIVDDQLFVTDLNIYSYYSSFYCLNPATGDIIWQKTVNSLVVSPMIVADGKIFLSCLDLNTYTGSLKCYDFSGNQLWNRPLSAEEVIWFSAPAYSDGRVFFISTNLYSYWNGKVYCLNAANGQVSWTKPVFTLWYFNSPSPVCRDAKVYVTDFNLNTYEGTLKCFDASTGNLLWTGYLGSVLSMMSPAVSGDSVYLTGMDLYSSYLDSWLYRFDATNGTYLWRVPLPASSYFAFGGVVCAVEKIIVTSGMYYGYTNDVYCYDRFDGSLNWKFTTDDYILGQPSIGDGRAYFADYAGNVYAVEDILKIQAISGGLFGVNAQIQNTGDSPITNIVWNISVVGGALGMVNQARSGTIQELTANQSRIIRLIPVLGIGKVKITVKATMPDTSMVKKVGQAMVFGMVCIMMS
jgi:outer membrane protein assembly factor BamB